MMRHLALCLALVCLGWTLRAQEAERADSTAVSQAAISQAAVTAPSAALSPALAKARVATAIHPESEPFQAAAQKEDEAQARYNCTASTICPGTPYNPNYTLTCHGDYECYSVPGQYVYCDGIGTLCFNFGR